MSPTDVISNSNSSIKDNTYPVRHLNVLHLVSSIHPSLCTIKLTTMDRYGGDDDDCYCRGNAKWRSLKFRAVDLTYRAIRTPSPAR
jgi:hypothetical protein